MFFSIWVESTIIINGDGLFLLFVSFISNIKPLRTYCGRNTFLNPVPLGVSFNLGIH